ncbi:DUF6776 family protein [Bordetella sp. H567]|uniref:DUF6776 family protein n=1 Tax=Bordetella sp. H567 TaxID=1697043 RepID=UPI000831A313|nr:DUF6776 family protein [Bordetella sp. H567]
MTDQPPAGHPAPTTTEPPPADPSSAHHPTPRRDTQPAAGFRIGVLVGVLATLVMAAILAGVIVLFQPAGADGPAMQARLAALQARAEQGQADIQALRGQLAASDADLAVERAARRGLEDNVAALQVQAGQLRDRLAFYDQLLPAGPAGTLSIRAVEFTHVPAGLRYRVLLMRSARPGLAPFVGSLRFVATGMREGVQVRLTLAPLQTAPAPGAGVIPDTAPATPQAPSSETGKTVTEAPTGYPANMATEAPSRDADAIGAGTLPGRGGEMGAATPPTDAASLSAPEAASGAAGASALVPLQVDQYRNSEGILALPPDFTPTEVAVEVVQDGAVRTSQQAAVAF